MRIEDYYYIDGNYFAKFKYTYENALEISKTLINCTDCVECEFCEDCNNCFDCHYCYECEKLERCFTSKNL